MHSADVQASRLEAKVPSMTESAIAAALAPIQEKMRGHYETLHVYGEKLDALSTWVKECEKIEGVLLS